MTAPLTARELDEMASVGVGWCDEATFERLLSMARALLDGGEWQGIESAPRDGTYVDLWIDGRRWADCYWGFPEHCCGEAGQYCDSDWHSLGPGWVESTFNLPIDAVEQEPTHWRHLPVPPTAPQEANPDDV